jgi:periplasmic divalent cation tolerance protein
MSFIDVWVNCPDRATAEAIAEACVDERLAACANIFGPITSIYRWKGAIECADEVPLLLKTRRDLFEKLATKVRALHPYEVPSIIATELPLVDAAYAKWLPEETEA